MLDLAGAPLVGRIIERVKRCASPRLVVLATTCKPEDTPLEALAAAYDIPCFRGPEHDLVQRYVLAAKEFDADRIIRLPGDNVAPEPSEIDRLVAYHLASDNAFSSNLLQIMGNGYPDGIGAEVIERSALEEVLATTDDPRLREHPHLNFFDFERDSAVDDGRFKVGTVACPSAFSRPDLTLDVNTQEQYEYCKAFYEYLYPRNNEFGILDIIEWHDNIWSPHRN